MRILVVNQYFPPDRSATAQLLGELCEDLARKHDVFVLAGRPSYNPAGDVNPVPGVDVMRAWSTSFNRASMPGRLSNYATFLSSSALAAVTRFRPDVVLSWTDPPIIGLVAAAAARRHRVPLVVGTQDIFPDVAIRLGKLRNPAAIAAFRRAARTLFRSAARIVSLGRDMDRRLLDLGVPEGKIIRVSNWADGDRIRPVAKSKQLREEWGFDGKFVVMHAGNIGLSQSLGTLLDAAELLRAEASLVIAIAGEGVSRAHLVREVERRGLANVRFIAYQPTVALAAMLSAADAQLVSLKRGLEGFIVPSKTYGIMAAGQPMIAAVAAGAEPALIVQEHACGVHAEPDDPQALAGAILAMRGSDRVAMGRRARRAFEKHYDRKLATAAYERCLATA